MNYRLRRLLSGFLYGFASVVVVGAWVVALALLYVAMKPL